MSGTIIDIDRISYDIGQTPILQEISLTIQNGEFIGIFGPNGGGKTTLLQLILGLIQPTKGHIRLSTKGETLPCREIGYVPQIAKFDRAFPISVLEVVLMGLFKELSFLGTWNKKAKTNALEALEKVGLKGVENAPFAALSGGQAQRVLFARALVSSPQLLLLDEPTASVDPQAEQIIHKLLLELKGKVTILMVTHDLQTILQDVNRLLFVQKQVTVLDKSQVCGHFALGLYHSPLQPLRPLP